VVANHLQEYMMFVEGVECKFCAQTVIDLIKDIPGVSRARYHTTDDTYQESYVTYMFDERMPKIEEEQLNAALLKEGFSLKSIRPSFWAPIR
jgi:copper chaperone CopZ